MSILTLKVFKSFLILPVATLLCLLYFSLFILSQRLINYVIVSNKLFSLPF